MNATEEQWLPVVGWEDLYEVSDRGRVRSLDRIIDRSDGVKRPLKGRVLKPYRIKQGGYLQVALPGSGSRQIKRKIHHLVLEAFVGPRPLGLHSCHSDGDPANNAVSNLYWGTPSENMWDRVRHGNDPHASKDRCKWGHEFTPENTGAQMCRGKWRGRSCRTCNSKAWRKYMRQLREQAAATLP